MSAKPGWHEMRFVRDDRKVAVACGECGVAMWLPPSKVSMYRSCSPACGQAARKRAVAARERPCETCGATFTPRRIQVTKGGGRFCSQACNTAAREALCSPESLARAAERARELRAAGVIKNPRGPEHPQWMGGPKAAARRRIESGKAAETLRRYRAANPDKTREFAQRRKARKLGRLERGTIPRVGKAQKWKCAICAVRIKNAYHVDHIVPLALGGQHVGRNIQLLCPSCNFRKSDKDPVEYMRQLGRLL